MGRGSGAGHGSAQQLLYGRPRTGIGPQVPVALSAFIIDDEEWCVGDQAVWYPSWTGPVEVRITSLRPDGSCEIEIIDRELDEFGEVWEAHTRELDT